MTLRIPGVPDTCGSPGDATLSITYSVQLAPPPPVLGLSVDAVLSQSVSIHAVTAGCVPSQLFSVRLPRAATLVAVAPAATRWVRGWLASGSETTFAVTGGGEPNGLLFVSAGTYSLGPHKVTPAYPSYTVQVPAVEEFLVAATAPADAGLDPQVAALRLQTSADAYYLTSFTWGNASWSNAFEWSYNCSDVFIDCFVAEPVEQRTMYTAISSDGDVTLDTFMRKMYAIALADEPAPAQWVQNVALTNYDYFSPLPPSMNGFEADVAAIAAALPNGVPPSAVAMCVHGWYGLVGQYTLTNLSQPALAEAWDVFPSGAAFVNPVTKTPLGPVPITRATLHSRLQAARAAGFRVLLYFADALNSYSGVPFAAQQVALSTYAGYEWNGPDTAGTGFVMNPLHAATRAQFLAYTTLLLDEYGADIDGLVWDETFMLPHDQRGDATARGYAARAFMRLIRDVRAAMKAHAACAARECALMVADCMHEMPMALVADGTWEDTGLNGAAAPAGALRNWRGALWECGWADISRGYDQRNSTEEVYVAYNAAGGISNGWGDFVGFANMTPPQQSYFMSLLARHNASEGPRLPPSAAPRA